jgi:hypothetical protein
VIAYLEASAAAKLLTREPEAEAVTTYLNELVAKGDGLASSSLLETELRRAAFREGIAQASVTALLDRVDVFDLERSMFTEAGIIPGRNLGSLDALHITAALRMNADVVLTYDRRLSEAAEAAGLRVHSPA